MINFILNFFKKEKKEREIINWDAWDEADEMIFFKR